MIINELKLPFPIYTRRLRQNRFRENCAGQLNYRLISPNNALLPFQFRVEGLEVPPTVVSWKLNRVCPQFITTVVNGEFSTEFEDSEFPVVNSGGGVPVEVPSTLTIVYDQLVDELGDPLLDELGQPILTGEVDITGETYNLTGLASSMIRVYNHNGGFNIAYNGNVFPFALDCGYYEMFIKLSNGLSFWSEVFQAVEYGAEAMPYLKLGWGNPSNLEKIVFNDGFEPRVYFNSFISHSEPQIIETVEKDGLGVEIVTGSVSVDRYVFSEIVPDYLKNALAAAPVCRTIYIEDPKTMVSIQASRMRTTSQIEGTGCDSFIEMQFEVNNEMFRTACE